MLHNATLTTTTGCADTLRLSVAISQRKPHLFSSQQLSSCTDRQYLLPPGQFSATVQPVVLLTSQLVLLTRLWFTWTRNTDSVTTFQIFPHWTRWAHSTESDFFLVNVTSFQLKFSGILCHSRLFLQEVWLDCAVSCLCWPCVMRGWFSSSPPVCLTYPPLL